MSPIADIADMSSIDYIPDMSSIDDIPATPPMLIRTAKELGLLLRDRRRATGLSQQDFADRLGVSRSWLIEVEQGKPRAAIGLVLRALAAVDVTLDARVRGDVRAAAPSRQPARDAGDLDAIVDRHRRRPAKS